MNKNVLFLEGEKPASYAAMRSLHKLGYAITSASHIKINISRFSKYVTRAVHCPDTDENINEYIKWLIEEIKNGGYLTVFSFSDKTTKILSENKAELSSFTCIYQPEISKVEIVLNKTKTYLLAKSLGMELPEIYENKGKNTDELAEELKFPLVLRPKQKIFYHNGQAKYYKVTSENYFWNKNDFLQKIPKFIGEMDKYDLMSFVNGVGRGYFTIVNGRETNGNFAHERIREYPVSGGASSFRKSIHFEEIRKISLPLINALNWSGPIMIEYKYDVKTDKYYLIEVNGRWWGSLPLAIHAGVDFPKIMMDIIKLQPSKGGIMSETTSDYKINFTSRLLIPHDIMCFISCLIKGKFRELPQFFKKADKEDIFDKGDLRAYIAYIISLFSQLKLLRV